MIRPNDAFAVISDVNGNLEALVSVLEDIETRGIQQVLFLGDAIGHGPNPLECIEILMNRANVYLLGRYEAELLAFVSSGISESRVLQSCLPNQMVAAGYVEWLSSRHTSFSIGDLLAVHTNPKGTRFGCLRLEDMSETAFEKVFPEKTSHILIGDNHQQWIYSPQSKRKISPHEQNERIVLQSSEKVIVSVGSAGFPRDGDPRACYGIISPSYLELRRVEYDVEAAIEKILGSITCTPGLDERLRHGI